MYSIIIPVYNKSQYIEKCLNSVINQTFRDFEIIIINDGSKDESLEILKKISDGKCEIETNYHQFYLDNTLVKLVNQENLGVSMARNNGFKLANFEYCAFLDADDWWDVHFLEEMSTLIKEFPEAGLYGCNYFYVKNGRPREKDKGLPLEFHSGYIDYFKIYGGNFTAPVNCSFMVMPKRTFLSAGGFNPDLKYGEDFDLWVRIALHSKVAYLNKPLSYSNQDADGASRAVGNSHLFHPENHYIFNLDYLSEEEQRNFELKSLLDGLRVRSLIRFHLHNKFGEKVKKELAKVDLNNQPFYFRFIYNYPRNMVRLFFGVRTLGSGIKQLLFKKTKGLR